MLEKLVLLYSLCGTNFHVVVSETPFGIFYGSETDFNKYSTLTLQQTMRLPDYDVVRIKMEDALGGTCGEANETP